MMQRIVVHHFGGLGNDAFAKTQHLTLEHINNAHKARWPNFTSKLGSNVGYNIVIFPDYWIQTRVIGEETAAQKGYNFDSISIVLAGNFNLKGGQPVEQPTQFQKSMLTILLAVIANGSETAKSFGLKTEQIFNADIARNIVAHRYLASTDCYGTGLSDLWAMDLITKDTWIVKIVKRLLEFMRPKEPKFGAMVPSCFEHDNRG